MKECNLLQTYEIFLKIMYLKLLQEYWTYEWDLWNRLVKVVQYNAPDNGECVEVSYEYDALNHRISRTTDSETTKYAYGRNGALAYQEKTIDGSAFISEDPARDGANWYVYCNNNPLTYTDPLGLYPYNNLNEAMEDYYTNYATDADRKQMHFFGLIDQASMGNKSAQNTLNYAFYQANKEMLKDLGDASGNASLVFLAIGLPEVSTVLGGIDTVSDLIIGADKVINGYKNNDSKMRTEGWLEIASSTSEFVASEVIIKGITNKVSSSINVTIGKNGRYYELGRRGALKSKKAIQKLVKKDIAEGYFGQNIAPELASQIVDKAGEAALVVSGVKEKLSIGERIFPQLRKGGKDAEKK